MRINIAAVFLILLFSACHNNTAVPKAMIQFEKDTFNFGSIRKGDSVNALFQYRNSGNADLRIKNVGVSCGCTDARALENSIPPSASGEIMALYHSDKDSGHVLKTIIVESNTTPVLKVLYITGTVK